MVKKLFKGALCAALSLSMALGSVMVGASDGAEIQTANLESNANVVLPKNIKGKKQISMNTSKARQAKTANLESISTRKVSTINNWNSYINEINKDSNFKHSTPVWQVNSKGYVQLIKINVTDAGSIMIPCVAISYSDQEGTKDLGLKLMNSNNQILNNSSYDIQKGLLWAYNIPKGTYYLSSDRPLSENMLCQSSLEDPIIISNANNRTLGSTALAIGGTGKSTYQKFVMKKRGVATFQVYSSTPTGTRNGSNVYVQNSKGKTISGTVYASSSANYGVAFGLSKGTYKLVVKNTPTNAIVFPRFIQTRADSSYGTTKKKAKTINRKKTKSQVILPTDSTKKAQWYKIKVTAKRNTYIDVTSLGQTGTIKVQVSGSTRFKSKKIKNGIRFYAKAKKGTYYIKVYKSSKKTTGGYKVKYTK